MIDVPDGYSVLFTHPFNYRPDAFRPIPGIVDEDQFPYVFWIPIAIDVTEGNVQFDEPIAQIIPFKRSENSIEADVAAVEETHALDSDLAGSGP